jgi:dipeptidase
MKRCFSLYCLLLMFAGNPEIFACTNLIVTKGASNDGSVMITYAADSHTRYSAIAFYPADHQPGDLCEVDHYENGKLLGTIPEAAHTCSVVQFMNEHQVAIGETTFGGLDSLSTQPGAILDYGSLMKIGLQRSKTAREMIRVMTELVALYGYASGGESFSISDANEAWIMEIIGKGKYEKGAVWVARLIPDGYVSGHANQARITTFPQQTGYSFVAQSRNWLPSPIGGIFWFGVDDTDGCVYAPMYCGIKKIPESYAWGNGSMISWSETSAFWTFNQVNNWAYTRYNMIHPEIESYQAELEKQFADEIRVTDALASSIYGNDPDKAAGYLTAYSVFTGNKLVSDWKAFYQYLFMKYMDGNLKVSEGRQLLDNGNGKNIPKRPSHPGYGKDWERIMIQGTGDRLRVPPGNE